MLSAFIAPAGIAQAAPERTQIPSEKCSEKMHEDNKKNKRKTCTNEKLVLSLYQTKEQKTRLSGG